jgi:glycosyltransferase involved in cell wall biosynthesis
VTAFPESDAPGRQEHTPLFSVVIATYNYGHMIERTIASVLAQTCKDFELIVIDDGSTDDTRERLEQYGDRVRYHYKENGGQSSAYNLGADLAKGRFIYILDSDDGLFPDALESFASAIRLQGHEAGSCLYFGGYVSVSENGGEKVREGTDAPSDPYQRLHAFLTKRLIGLKNGSFVIPRDAFSVIRYPEHLRNNTDIVFLGQAVALYPAIQIHKLVLRSCDHELRVRKQLQKVVEAGTAPVETLFDPAIIPARLMRLKRLHLGMRLRSIARMYYLNEQYLDARSAYLKALLTSPRSMFDLASFRRFVMAWMRSMS